MSQKYFNRIKSLFLIGLSILFTFPILGQNDYTPYRDLNGNNIKARINNNGEIFNKSQQSSAGYEYPTGLGNHLIYGGNFWFAGKNQNDELKISTGLYQNEKVFHRGPYSTTNSYLDPTYIYKYEQNIWHIKKSDIIYHMDNFGESGYTIPNNILTWPGNGDVSIGVTEQLAPFEDLNNNGIYEPHLGEYPCIKGDETVFLIINDRQTSYTTNIEMGIEVHITLYQFSTENFLNNTTFIDITIHNRGDNSYSDFKSAVFLDSDIGFAEDDYIGSAPGKHMMYSYNSAIHDIGQAGATGYGNKTPAVGLVNLNKEMEYGGYFNRPDLAPTQAMASPSDPEDFWNYMNGKWKDGTPWVHGGDGYTGSVGSTSTPTNFVFDGNPHTNVGWTEINSDGNGTPTIPNGSDRSFFISSGSSAFNPGDQITYNYAVIVYDEYEANEEEPYTYQNVNGLLSTADEVLDFFENTIHSCEQQGTGVTDVFEEEDHSLTIAVTRVDGLGNMGNFLRITPETEQNILDNLTVEHVQYQKNSTPIKIRLLENSDEALGHFVLKFNDYQNPDTASWTLYRYDEPNGTLLGSINSESTINIGEEQIIPDWNMAVQVKQSNYNKQPPYNPSRPFADPIGAELTFENEDNQWLTGVKNTSVISPLNWIKTGLTPNLISNEETSCYQENNYDGDGLYFKLLDGIVSSSFSARKGDCSSYTIKSPGINGITPSSFSTIEPLRMFTANQPSIDIVFTSDKTKWTRCPVIELGNEVSANLDGGHPGLLRESPSVDKNGKKVGEEGYLESEANPNGNTPTGMGWFPGYAIDIETGKRLNMAFGENSFLLGQNGGDMIWNPTENIIDENGEYVLGGQHVIYVFGSLGSNSNTDITDYNGGEIIHENLSTASTTSFRNVYQDLSWIVQPIIAAGKELNSSDARMSIRINKEFNTHVLSNENEGKPMFFWNVDEEFLSINDNLKNNSFVKLYPNPSTNILNIEWAGIETKDITIFSSLGTEVKQISAKGNKGQKTIEISSLSPGLYYVKIGNSLNKLIVQ